MQHKVKTRMAEAAQTATNSGSVPALQLTERAFPCHVLAPAPVLSSAHRQTDYVGGCNGAYLRLEPQRSWPTNKGLDKVLSVLEPIFDKYETLSYADLIVLAGTVAVAHAAEQGAAAGNGATGSLAKQGLFPFCPKRSDAALVGPESLDYLEPRSYKTAHIAFRQAPSCLLTDCRQLTVSVCGSQQTVAGSDVIQQQREQTSFVDGVADAQQVASAGKVRQVVFPTDVCLCLLRAVACCLSLLQGQCKGSRPDPCRGCCPVSTAPQPLPAEAPGLQWQLVAQPLSPVQQLLQAAVGAGLEGSSVSESVVVSEQITLLWCACSLGQVAACGVVECVEPQGCVRESSVDKGVAGHSRPKGGLNLLSLLACI
jgi:hypothetical protein